MDTAGVGPFDSQTAHFGNPTVQWALGQDVLTDVHKSGAQLHPAKFICPEVGSGSDQLAALFSTRPVIDMRNVGDDQVQPDLVEVMTLLLDRTDKPDPPTLPVEYTPSLLVAGGTGARIRIPPESKNEVPDKPQRKMSKKFLP